jgi:hypothetical protein
MWLLAFVVLALVWSSPALRSSAEAGSLLDCGDLVLADGLTCTEFAEPGEGGFEGEQPVNFVDNDGRLLTSEPGASEIIDGCETESPPVGSKAVSQYAVVSAIGRGATRLPLISVRERCVDGAVASAHVASLSFDRVRGVLYLSMRSNDPAPEPMPCQRCGDPLPWIARIDGFTPLADVLPPPRPLCSNGLDDDEDGDVDAADAHCKSDADNDESRP